MFLYIYHTQKCMIHTCNTYIYVYMCVWSVLGIVSSNPDSNGVVAGDRNLCWQRRATWLRGSGLSLGDAPTLT